MIRISASRLKTLDQCTMAFYMEEILRLPTPTHPKTIIGSLCHSIFASLSNSRHRKHYNAILGPPFGHANSKAVVRLVKMWQVKYAIPDELLESLDGMLYVGLVLTDFYFKNALKVFEPEYEFEFKIGEAVLKGYIDRMAEYDWGFLIRDYKSQAKRFTENELTNNIQAGIYQRAVWEKFRKPARVDFVMLRHPPTSRTPNKHIQSVEPKTEAQLSGLDFYLKSTYSSLNNFTLHDAHSHFCDNQFFCDNICGFRFPSDYQCVLKDGVVVKNYMLNDRVILKPGQIIERRHQFGCPKFNQVQS
jgi:PD-(D/E)XK nuclease superfamily